MVFELPQTNSGLPFTYLMEIQRQAGIAFAHRVLGVLYSDAFMLKTMKLSRNSLGSSLPHTGFVEIEVGDSKSAGGKLKHTQVHSKILDTSGTALFQGRLSSSFLSKDIYERIRQRTMAQPKTLDKCSICDNRSVDGALLDTAMPKLRDHDSDHLAAIEIVAAIEEGIRSNFQSEILGVSLSFNNYLELNPLPKIHFFSVASNIITGCIHQGQTLGATFQVETKKMGN